MPYPIQDLLVQLFPEDLSPHDRGIDSSSDSNRIMFVRDPAVYHCAAMPLSETRFTLQLCRALFHPIAEVDVDVTEDLDVRQLRRQFEEAVAEDLDKVRLLHAHAGKLSQLLHGLQVDQSWEPRRHGPGLNPQTISVWISITHPVVRQIKPRAGYRILFSVDVEGRYTATIMSDGIDAHMDMSTEERAWESFQKTLLGRLDGTVFLRVPDPPGWDEMQWSGSAIVGLCKAALKHIEATLRGRLLPWESSWITTEVRSFLLQHVPWRIAKRSARCGTERAARPAGPTTGSRMPDDTDWTGAEIRASRQASAHEHWGFAFLPGRRITQNLATICLAGEGLPRFSI